MLVKREQLLSIQKIINNKIGETFNIDTQYKFLLLNKKIQEEIEIVRTQVNFIINQYGEKDTNGDFITNDSNGIKIKEENNERCMKEVEQLYQYQVQVPDIYFSLEELKDLKLTLQDLINIEPFIRK